MSTVEAKFLKALGKDASKASKQEMRAAFIVVSNANPGDTRAMLDLQKKYMGKGAVAESTMQFPRLQMLAEAKAKGPNLRRTENTAVAGFIKMASYDPDSFGMDSQTSARDVMKFASGYATDIDVYEKGSHVHMIMNFDDCGGDSYNHEDVWVDSAGKFSHDVPAKAARGKLISKHADLNESLYEGKKKKALADDMEMDFELDADSAGDKMDAPKGMKAKGDAPIDKAAVLKFLKGCDVACRAEVHTKLMKMVKADEAAQK